MDERFYGEFLSFNGFFFSILVWLVSVWVIWKERNSRYFRQKTEMLPKILDRIKPFLFDG